MLKGLLRRSSSLFALVVAGLFCVLAVEAAADDPAPAGMSAEDVAERVQRFYQDTDDFQAAFLQTFTDVAAGEAKRSRGRVYFKKPGMMRWDYYRADDATRRDRVMVSDGNIFWVYEMEFQQVFKQCLAESNLPAALRFLMGEGNLLEEFDVEFADGSTAEEPRLRLTPKEASSEYRELRFVLDPESFQVTRSILYDPYGNTNEIAFVNTRLNRNLPESGFQFEPPEGARLLNPNQECD